MVDVVATRATPSRFLLSNCEDIVTNQEGGEGGFGMLN